jgi:hypothetical protein
MLILNYKHADSISRLSVKMNGGNFTAHHDSRPTFAVECLPEEKVAKSDDNECLI